MRSIARACFKGLLDGHLLELLQVHRGESYLLVRIHVRWFLFSFDPVQAVRIAFELLRLQGAKAGRFTKFGEAGDFLEVQRAA